MLKNNRKSHLKQFYTLPLAIIHGAPIDIEQMTEFYQTLSEEGHFDLYGAVVHILCSYAVGQHQWERCDALIEELRKSCELYSLKDNDSPVSTAYIHIYYHISLAGYIWYRQQDYDACNEHYTTAEKLLSQIDKPDYFTVQKVYHLYGTSLCSEGRFTEAYIYLNKALKCHLPEDLRYMKAASYKWLSIAAEKQTLYKQALYYALKSAEIMRKHQIKVGLCDTLNSIGLLHLKLGSPDEARQTFTESLEIATQYDLHRIIADALNNLGVYYDTVGEYEKAIECYQKVLPYRIETEPRYAYALGNIGNAYRQMKDFTSALKYYEQALAVSHHFTDNHFLTGLHYFIAVLHSTNKDSDKALNHLKQAEVMGLKSGAKEYLKLIYQLYTKVYEEHGDFKQALAYNKLYSDILKNLYEQSLKNIEEIAKGEGENT